jgi:dTDP-4-dehydrorhamnose reductase
MRILITGGEGQLGRALVAALSAAHDVTAPARSALDVTDATAAIAAVASARADVVIHCAALTDTARCEREPEIARAVNALGTEHVARACAAAGARLIAVSTNEVFDGAASEPYDEAAAARAINVYGATKLEGERRAVAAHAETLIVRTSWVYGGGRDFVAKVLEATRQGEPLRFVTDEVASPSLASDVAETIAALIERKAAPGVYHLTNEAEASRFEWAREIVRLAGTGPDAVRPVTTPELRASGYDGPRKPRYSVLANNHARALGVTLRPWREALAAHMAQHAAPPAAVLPDGQR